LWFVGSGGGLVWGGWGLLVGLGGWGWGGGGVLGVWVGGGGVWLGIFRTLSKGSS